MSQSNSPSRVLITRVLMGVASLGTGIGILYLLYKSRQKKEPSSDSTSSMRRKKRIISGEKNRVTFSDQHQIFDASPPPSSSKDDMEDDVRVSPCPSPKEEEARNDLVGPSRTIFSSIPPEEQVKASVVNGREEPSGLKEDKIVEVATTVTDSASQPAPNGIQQAITPETDYDRNNVTKEIKIGRDLVPGLIGKKGFKIRSIQNESNTIINFKDESLDNGDRICVIRGQPQSVSVAESLIEKFILEQPILTAETMQVPHSAVGRIIGRGGESIRAIQDLSKAKVIVDTANQFHHRAGSDGARMVTVTLRGTEDQIYCAKQAILDKVDEEKSLRRNIDVVTQNRTPRRPASNSPSSSGSAATNGNHPEVPLLPVKSGVMEVFVCCAYHPNDFWVQVMGRESIDLDKLTETMTEWYSRMPPEKVSLSVGEIIAAPFDVDGKMYRGKILKLQENNMVEVSYVDYGDKRIINKSEIKRIHPEFLQMRFQAIQATLNLGCAGDRWTDEAIAAFCDLTYCAQWRSLTARVKDYLRSTSSNETVLSVELLDKDLNIGDELIRRGFATKDEDTSADTRHKSYASVASVQNDDTKEQPWEEDNVNGN